MASTEVVETEDCVKSFLASAPIKKFFEEPKVRATRYDILFCGRETDFFFWYCQVRNTILAFAGDEGQYNLDRIKTDEKTIQYLIDNGPSGSDSHSKYQNAVKTLLVPTYLFKSRLKLETDGNLEEFNDAYEKIEKETVVMWVTEKDPDKNNTYMNRSPEKMKEWLEEPCIPMDTAELLRLLSRDRSKADTLLIKQNGQAPDVEMAEGNEDANSPPLVEEAGPTDIQPPVAEEKEEVNA